MKIIISLSLCVLLLLKISPVSSQQIKFNKVFSNNSFGLITAMAQDQQGFIWFTQQKKGLLRYDGSEFKTYAHDPKDPNSLTSNDIECLFIDVDNILWVGFFGSGLDRFDPVANTFTHFRHDQNDNSSLRNDTVAAILKDHLGNLWIGTYGGLNLLDQKTGKFTLFANNPNDPTSLSSNRIRAIYEDKNGTIWVGCGTPFPDPVEKPEVGGLNRFDRKTGKFIRYLHDQNNPNSIANNKVRAIFEDSKGNFWVGTAGDGLHTMDREKGIFTHYYYDSAHPEKLSRPVLFNSKWDHITFITEDASGAIWIGTLYAGINRYDPDTKKTVHHGSIFLGNQSFNFKDTITGLKDFGLWKAIVSKDNLLWICTVYGNIYNINPRKTTIPYYLINKGLNGNTFYHEQNGNTLWIGTNKGLIRKNLNDQTQKNWVHDALNSNSLSDDNISAMRIDGDGKLWMATVDGLCKFDPVLNTFTTFRHNEKDPSSLSSKSLNNLCIDSNKNIWIATAATGLDKLDTKTGIFTNFRNNQKDSASLTYNIIYCVVPGPDNEIWVGTGGDGVNRLNQGNGRFRHYLPKVIINSIFIDASGIVWAGTPDGLYYFDKATDQFLFFTDDSQYPVAGVLHIIEDDHNNLWVSSHDAIVKINEKRNEVKRYGKSYGVHINTFAFADNFKAKNGQLFFGDQAGYYSFFPDKIKDADVPPTISFTSFKLGDQEIKAEPGSVLNAPIWKTNEIKLNYNQNVFSFDFVAISYTDPDDMKYMFMLENNDNTWHNIGTDHKAYFFNVPPGRYIFHVRGVDSSGLWGEKTIRIVISPPWWKTWWAYSIFALLFIGIITGFISFRSRALRRENRVLEEKVAQRTEQLKQSLEDLKSTQSQLIQSEKMASLGELTAGIAHEIQNPLNFVNNFSEVNIELIEELNDERRKEIREFKNESEILNDIKENEQKINHHGKRADAIVKGMLQHSRSSSGVKEPTNINALADEYLRLAYHGLRAKDKSFNATMKTDFDETIGKINVIPQDIGRVILNLITNAFYAVNEKKRNGPLTSRNEFGTGSEGGIENPQKQYEPTVTVSTKLIIPPAGGMRGALISVRDNGNGIPQKVIDKIFQPFFTTKPTGEGTGLGLSMSYDIITKVHGGELKVETKEGEGAEFTIILPVKI